MRASRAALPASASSCQIASLIGSPLELAGVARELLDLVPLAVLQERRLATQEPPTQSTFGSAR